MKKQFEKPYALAQSDKPLILSGIQLSTLLYAIFSRGKSFRFKARGFSMSPCIKDGDVLTVSPAANRPVTFGDIVVYRHPQTRRTIIHRVVGKKKSFCRVRGDNSYVADGLIPDKNILGSVAKIERKGRLSAFGLGPERFLIALLSRTATLLPLQVLIKKLIRPVVRSSTA